MLLRRYQAIMPGWITYFQMEERQSSSGDYHDFQRKYRCYQYQWHEPMLPVRRNEDIEDGQKLSPSKITNTIATVATTAQIEVFEHGQDLPYTFDSRYGKQVAASSSWIYHGDEDKGCEFYQVINEMELIVEPFGWLSIMRANKQTLEE